MSNIVIQLVPGENKLISNLITITIPGPNNIKSNAQEIFDKKVNDESVLTNLKTLLSNYNSPEHENNNI